MKKALSLLLAVVMIIGLLPVTALTAGAAEESATITFDDTSKRTTFTTSQQIWEENGIVVTNNKGSSTSPVADYAKPARFYKNSELIVEFGGKTITKIEFTCNSASYATAMANSCGGTASDKVVTVTPNATSYTVAKLSGGQVRMDSLTVYAEAGAGACQHTETVPSDENKAATCTTDGLTGATVCADCDAVVDPGTVIPALGHNYVDGTCTNCGQADPTIGVTVVTDPQPATAYKLILDQKGLGKVLYFNGSVGSKTYYLATTENAAEAVDVYLDAVDGGYQLYFLDNGTKTYIRVSRYLSGSYGKGTMELTTTQPAEVMTYDTTVNTLIYKYDDSESYYIGTYGTYDTFSVSSAYYITGDNAGTVDVSQFPARFATVAGSEGGDTTCQHTNTTTTPGTAATCTTAGTTDTIVCNDCGVTLQAAETIPATGHNYVDGVCGTCGDVAATVPTIPETGNYELVTDIAEITAGGKFVIVANYKDVPYAMGTISSGKAAATEVVVKDGKVAYIEGVTPTWTVASYNGGIAIVNGDKYVGYNSGTDFSNMDSAYAWTVTANEDGTFYATASGDAARQIALYDNYGTIKIGAYSNAGTNLTSYYYAFGLSFYKLTEGEAQTFTSTIVTYENGETANIVEQAVGTTYALPEVEYIPEGYTFAGWTTTEANEETVVAPEVLAAGTEITVGNDATYYAVYTRTETVAGGTVYSLVTDTLAVGDVIIIGAATEEYALGTNQKSNNREGVSAAKGEGTITYHETVQLLTVEAGTQEGTFAFNTGAGYLYAASSSSNYLRTETTLSDNSSWVITISADGVATATAQGTNTRNQMKFNLNNGNPIFACYASGQKDIAFYKQTSGTSVTAYYTTYVEPPVPENSAENPYYVEWIWNDAQTEATASVTVAAGTTYYCASNITGLELFINGTSYGVLTGSRWDPAKFTVVNDTDAEATYELKIVVPVGSMDNPDELVIGYNTFTVAEGAQGYFYTWTATEDGTLSIIMPEGNWVYCINNMTSYVYGDTQWSDSDPVVNPAKVEVKAGDVLQIMVNTYDPANEWVAPAGTLTFAATMAEPEPEIEKFDIDVARMILGNALEFQFGVAKTKFTTTEGYYAVIEKTWADGTTTEKTIPASEWGVMGGYYAIIYDGLAAKEMGDTFYVTIYNEKGQAVSNAKEDSVRAYVARAYAGQPAKGKTMMVDMLNYGAAAQVHFSYGTDDLANSGLTDEQKAVATATAPEMSNDQVKGTNYQGTRFLLTSAIQVQLAFKNMTTDMYAIYTYQKADGTANEVRVEGTDFVVINGKPAGVELSALVYSDARALVNVTVYNADGTVYGTASDSIESCALRSDADVFVALMKFADSAKASLYG